MNEHLLKEKVDLTNCEREPIHIPGCIQPHGVLIVLKESELTILQVSTNIIDITGLTAQAVINKKLETILEPSQVEIIKQSLLSEDLQAVNPLKLIVKLQGQELFFDGLVHRIDEVLILELEPTNFKESTAFVEFLLKAAVARLQRTTNLLHLCQVAAEEVRKITKFDRVLVYQFDQDWNGIVHGEDKVESLESFLTLRFPASDIPKQARELYLKNYLRIISDADYQPATVVPADTPVTQSPLNLSFSVLRGVSPMHIEYLKNMGVSASMSIAILQEEQLWGLIVCHHTTPKYVPHEIRKACEFIGQTVSSLLSAKQDYADYVYETNVKSILTSLLGNLNKEEQVIDGLVKYASKLTELVSASGLVICFEDRFVAIGKTPGQADVKLLLDWLKKHISKEVFHTDSLPSMYQEAEPFKDTASGILAIQLSNMEGNYIIWFRPEAIQTMNWGGDPNKALAIGTYDLRLHPRKSFELWKQTIQLTSLPWKSCELKAIAELKDVVVEILRRENMLKQRLSSWLNR